MQYAHSTYARITVYMKLSYCSDRAVSLHAHKTLLFKAIILLAQRDYTKCTIQSIARRYTMHREALSAHMNVKSCTLCIFYMCVLSKLLYAQERYNALTTVAATAAECIN
jgi:hypothetical protein